MCRVLMAPGSVEAEARYVGDPHRLRRRTGAHGNHPDRGLGTNSGIRLMLENALVVITDGLIYLANGGLVIAYLFLDNLAHWAALGCAAIIGLTFDRLAQQAAVFAPGRYSDTAAARLPRTAQATTLTALGLWLAATMALGAPVPAIGSVMWCLAVVALLMMPQQRWTLLWSTKAGLIVYSLAVIGYRLFLWQAGQLSPAELAGVFGGAQAAGQVLAQNLGTVRTVGAWLLWIILPAGYAWILIQNWAAQPMSIVGPWQGAQDVIAALRTRGARHE